MQYNLFPIKIGAPHQDSVSSAEITQIPATEFSVDFSPQLNERRLLSRKPDSFRPAENLTSKISLTSFLSPDFSTSGYSFLNSAESYCSIKIGGNTFKKCYLDQYSVEIDPFLPVQISASFSCYNAPSGEVILEDAPFFTGHYANSIVEGHHSVLNSTPFSHINAKISYSKTIARYPVYSLGSPSLQNSLIDTIDEEMTIESTGLHDFIDFKGTSLTTPFSISLLNSTGGQVSEISELSMPANSHITQQSYSNSAGEIISAKTVIKNMVV